MRNTADCERVFQLNGQRVTISHDPDGWVTASLPISGSPKELLYRQAGIHGPAKVAAGPSLRAELPVKKDAKESFAALRPALEEGLKIIGGGNGAPLRENFDREELADTLAEYFSSCPRECSREGKGFLIRVETDLFAQKVRVETEPGCIFFRADLIRLRSSEPVSLRAHCHFLLSLNSRLRLARGSLLENRVVLEAVIPALILSPWIMDKAVGAIITGAKMAKRECALLQDPDVAQTYCEFHIERG